MTATLAEAIFVAHSTSFLGTRSAISTVVPENTSRNRQERCTVYQVVSRYIAACTWRASVHRLSQGHINQSSPMLKRGASMHPRRGGEVTHKKEPVALPAACRC